MTPDPPPIGYMRLGDEVDSPLTAGAYTLQVSTFDAKLPTHDKAEHAFEISGPQLSLDASQVASMHPPKDAVGTFHDALPHVALGRRTLPWERELDPKPHLLADPTPPTNPSAVGALPADGTPWLALLVFVDEPDTSEVTVLSQVPLSTVVPDTTIRGRLAVAGDPPVDAIEVDGPLLRAILPSLDEIRLLCHVRQVNTLDRELAANDSDGWFAVVVANRLPRPGSRHRACLVSLEARTDLVLPDPWRSGSTAGPLTGPKRLILLHSWRFTSDDPLPGNGSFKELSQRLDYGLIGTRQRGIVDTGHLPIELHDRAGQTQTVWYRGPFVPQSVDRDTLGPYHSADQARRVAPETGIEDISYSAAFELGRLLASADARLAQEIMGWRRNAYEQAARDTLNAEVQALSATMQPTTTTPATSLLGLSPALALATVVRTGSAAVTVADTTGRELVSTAPGLDITTLGSIWNKTGDQVSGIVGSTGTTTAPELEPRAAAPNPTTRLEVDPEADVADLREARRRFHGGTPKRTGAS